MADKKTKKPIKFFDRILICIFFISALTAGLYYFKDNSTINSILIAIPTYESLGVLGTCAVSSAFVVICFAIITYKQPKEDIKKKLGGDKMGSSRWLRQDEIDKEFPKIEYGELQKTKVNGFVIATEIMPNGKTYANYKGKTHCLVIGTTGSGKTSRMVLPTLQFLARSKQKPSVVLADPKAELFEKTSKTFQDNGYKIISINLRDVIDKSDCWNPCFMAWKYYQEAVNQKNLIKVVKGMDQKTMQQKYKVATDLSDYKEEFYVYSGIAFANLDDCSLEIKRRESTLKGKAIDEINDIVLTLFPEKDPKDSYWVKSAANVVAGILIGMLEDSENPELGITENNFNLSSVASNLTLNASAIMDYFDIRDVSSAARARARGTLSAGGETKGTITSTIQSGLYPFTEPDIQYCTCQNDIDLTEVGKKPCAVYLIVPDEKENRHVFASLFITQLYKALIDVASHTPENCLPHPVNFILDEFANIPKIPGMDNKITVSRSRGIFFMLIIQGLNQLEEKYGKVGDTIRDNCNLLVYLATNDYNTAKYFSDLCGMKTDVNKSESKSKGKDKSTSTSSSLSSEPLIRPEELLRVKEGECIVKMLRCQPARLKQGKWWESKYNTEGAMVRNKGWERNVFTFEETGFYNIETTIKFAEEKAREERRKKLNDRKGTSPDPVIPRSKPESKPTPPPSFDDDEDDELESIKAFLESLEMKEEQSKMEAAKPIEEIKPEPIPEVKQEVVQPTPIPEPIRPEPQVIVQQPQPQVQQIIVQQPIVQEVAPVYEDVVPIMPIAEEKPLGIFDEYIPQETIPQESVIIESTKEIPMERPVRGSGNILGSSANLKEFFNKPKTKK